MPMTKTPKQTAYAEAYIAWAYARALHTSGDVGRAEVARQDARWNIENEAQGYVAFVRLLETNLATTTMLDKIAGEPVG